MANEAATKGKPGPKKQFSDAELAQRNRDRNREARRQQSAAGQKITPIPPVENFARKESCRLDFAQFCTMYLGYLFDIPFCDDHRKVIVKIEESILRGGLFALAMPRGMGKTSLSLAACVWAILYGHRHFVFMIGATAAHAEEQLNNFRWICEDDEFELLYRDFPEVVHPIRELDGEPKRQGGQRTAEGDKTGIHWGGKHVVMPTVPDGPYYEPGKKEPSRAAGSRINISGITGRVRGFNVKKERPDFVIVDDPQTNDSAASVSQCEKRERVLSGVAIGLAGPRKRISGIMPCTVIRGGDMADNILSHEKHPEWDSSRTKLLYSFPKQMDLWETYREIRTKYDPTSEGSKVKAENDASCFYAEHQAAMDADAKVAWTEKYNPDEFSAIQNAMNLFFQDKRAFAAECQNEPLAETGTDFVELTPLQIASKVNRLPRRALPAEASRVTAFIDIQGEVLFYVVAAWCDDFTGYVVDYGSYPDQRKSYFTLHDLTATLATATQVQGLEGQLYAGLDALTTRLLGSDWQREGGAGLRVERCLVDARWGDSTDVVYQFCRQSAYSAILMPSFGKGVGASSNPLTHREKKPGERFGLNWLVTTSSKRAKPHCLYDTNFWKSFLASRWLVAHGNPGCISLYGTDPRDHQMYADHLTAEYRVRVEGRGRSVDEWKLPPGRRNDFLDCTVGCAVAASMLGVSLDRVHESTAPKKAAKPITLAEMKRAAAKG